MLCDYINTSDMLEVSGQLCHSGAFESTSCFKRHINLPYYTITLAVSYLAYINKHINDQCAIYFWTEEEGRENVNKILS